MIYISAETSKLHINFKLEQPVTIVVGNSGSGKTYVCDVLNKCKSINSIQISEDFMLNIPTTLNDVLGILNDDRRHVIVLDKFEQWGIEDKYKAEKAIISDILTCEGKNYYIIMHRGLSFLDCYGSKVYSLVYDNKTVSLKGENRE